MLRRRHHFLSVIIAAVALGGSGLLLAHERGSVSTTPQARPAADTPSAAGHVTSPKEEWGHNIGDDYFLANYQQLMAYWRKLEKESPRVHIVDIGKSSEGRPTLMAIITSPENYAKIEHYRDISRRLALAEGLTDAEAHALAKEGKSVVWIDGGIHADEVLGSQQLIEQVYEMASGTDEETMRFLNDTIELCVLVNPDGMDLVSDWYNRNEDPLARSTGNLPVLYNHYAGHDDNRDFYMQALAESTNVNKVLYRDWIPQIMYNHHQTGPAGTVMFAPPFRDPFNYNFHPGAVAGIDVVGSMMAMRFIAEGKPGVTQRKGAPYSTWFNGGIRTTAHFHNIIGILTETIGNPTPQSIPFVAAKQIGDSSLWWPIQPQQEWHFIQSIAYSMTANRAILDFASKYREENLYNIYVMGRDEITWGSQDHWTFTPHKMAKVQAALVAKGLASPVAIPGAASTSTAGGGGGRGGGRGAGGRTVDPLYAGMTTPELRDPRGFIIPSSQDDFGTATKFVNALIKAGVTVMRATAPFTVAGKPYPANSYIVKTAQAFRPHVMDMFEPQDHPDDIPYPGGPPTPPYDATGYTLAFQMGVQFDRILDAFDGPFQKLTDFATPPAGVIKSATSAPASVSASLSASTPLSVSASGSGVSPAKTQSTTAGYYFTHNANDSFIVVNRLLAAGEDVSWLAAGPMGTGTFYVAAKPTTLAIVTKAAKELGISFESTATAPAGSMAKLKGLRIGLYDQYGGSMPSGWTRLILEQFEFPGFDKAHSNLVFPPDLDKGDLRSKYDVLVFVDGGVAGGRGAGVGAFGGTAAAAAANAGGGGAPAAAGANAAGAGRGAATTGAAAAPAAQGARGGRSGGGRGGAIPEQYQGRQGQVTAATMEKVKEFVNAGGTVIYVGDATTAAAQQFGLPIANQLAGLSQDKYYVPGALLTVAVDNTNPLAHGMGKTLDVFFNNNPAFKLTGDAANTKSVAWFDSPAPLHSGWAWGQEHLDKGIEVVSAKVGQGKVFLFAPEILFRSQPHSNYKFFFNALYLSVTGPGLTKGE